MLENMPRIRDVETMLRAARRPRRRGGVDGRATRCASAPPGGQSTPLDERLAERIRASILLAGPAARPLRQRGRPAAGRRRHRPPPRRHAPPGASPLSAPRSRPTATTASRAPGGLKGAELSSTRPRSRARRTRVMAAVLARRHDDDPQRRLRAARAGSVPAARGHGRRASTASARTCCASTGQTRLGGCRHRVGPDHIEVGSFIGLAAVTGGDVTIAGCEPDDLRATLHVFTRLGVRGRDRRPRRARAARPGAARRRRRALPDRQDRGRPVAGVPGRPHVDRRRRGHPGHGHRARLREDVREPPVLHGQARQHGRADHPLRPAPGRRHRPARSSTGSGSRAPTSVPAWRC